MKHGSAMYTFAIDGNVEGAHLLLWMPTAASKRKLLIQSVRVQNQQRQPWMHSTCERS
jgi:hypothetical protein